MKNDRPRKTGVVDNALSLLKKRDRVRQEINEGVTELGRGERIDGGDVFAELEENAADTAAPFPGSSGVIP